MIKKNPGLVLSLIISLVFSLFYLLGLTDKLDINLGYDTAFLLKKETKPNNNIKIIGIDQKSLDYIGTFPWRRDLYAKLIDTLGNKPKIIGFDIIMPEHSDYIEDDKLLSLSIKKSNKIVLPISLEPDKNNLEFNFIYPLDIFQKNAKGIGSIHFFPDSDGIVRKTNIKYGFKNDKEYINIFSYILAKNFLGRNTKYLENIPKTIYCNFQGNQEIFDIYSFYDIISNKVDPEVFKNSIVLIGGLAEGLQDRISTPIGPMYGVVYHAQLVSNILDNDFIEPVSKKINILLILLVSLLAFISWKYLESVNQALMLIFFLVSLYTLHIILFNNNLYINIFTIMSANIFTSISLIILSQYKISNTLKLQVDNLINFYQNRTFNYFTNINNETKKRSEADISTKRIKILSEISSNLTIERTFLETLINNIDVSIIVTDLNGEILVNNQAAELLFEDKILNNNIKNISVNIPEFYEQINNIYSSKSKLPLDFQIEIIDHIFKIKVFNLNDRNIVYIINNITDWHKMANKDGLTGLWNQRYFKENLKKEIERSIRYKTNISLIMMDIDHFKRFNDTYGHQTGDIVLKTIGETILRTVRSTDIASRYGGEEFAIILTMTDEEGAVIIAERLREEIEKLKIKDINGNPVRQVTSSIGVSYYENYSLNEFIEYADKSLYSCKERGRNCVTKFSDIKNYNEVKKENVK